MDIATLGIAVDARPVVEADKALDNFANTGAKAESQAKEVSSATDAMAANMRELVAALRENTSATSANTSASASNANAAKAMSEADKAAASAKRASAEAAREAANASKTLADAEARAAQEASELADRVMRLKGSVDPFGLALDKANAELAEAKALMSQGAISSAEYDHAVMALTSRTEMLAAKQEISNKHLSASRTGFKLTATEGLNFSRQMADIGVTAAMGMNPLMIAIQQGPQLFDIMQTAAVRTGGSISSVFKAVGATIWGALLPILPIIAAIGVAVGVVASVWGLSVRSMNKSIGENIDHLKLNEKQLKKLKEDNVELGVTAGDVWRGLGTTIKEVFVEVFGEQLAWVDKKWNGFLDDLGKNTWKEIEGIVGFFGAGYGAAVSIWQNFPKVFEDFIVNAANFGSKAINSFVRNSVNEINFLISAMNVANVLPGGLKIPEIKQPGDFMRTDRQGNGAMADVGAAAREGYENAVSGLGDLRDRARENVGDSRNARLRKAGGDAGSGGASGGESDYDKQLKASREFLKSLKEETAEIGLNAIQVKMASVEREAMAATTKGATDESRKLAAEIRAAGQAWKDGTNKQATEELRKELADLNEQTEFENSLLGMNAQQREVANAQRAIDIALRNLEREGYDITTEALQAETAAILKNAEAKGALLLATQKATEAEQDLALRNDRLNSLVSGFGDLFGSQGAAIQDMIGLWTGYGEHVLSINNRIAEAERQHAEGKISDLALDRERMNSSLELKTAEQQYYNDMLSSAKGFFDQKSLGYKVLRTAEQAYRIYQFAMKAQAILMDGLETSSHVANSGTRMATDATETASSVAKSGVRAAADGVAAFAKTLASLPFPFNLAAGAAVLAALVGVGVAMKGGKTSATASASNDNSTAYNPPSSYTPFASHDTGTPGYLNHSRIPTAPVASVGNSRTNVFDFSGANFGNQDPEAVKQAVRDGIAEAKPDLLGEAREQSQEDLKALARQRM